MKTFPKISRPRVTVGIPVYMGEDFIRKAIDSVLFQTYADWELIICDNASTDSTGAIAKVYAASDERIRYYRNERNLGASANYNRCVELARGEYFKWLAHDDWISPNYITACVDVLDRAPDASVAFGMPIEMQDEENRHIHSAFTIPMWGNAGPVERFARAMRMVRSCPVVFGLYRRELLEKTSLIRPYYSSDAILAAETALLGRLVVVPEAIFYNRKHEKQSMAKARSKKTTRASLGPWIGDPSRAKPYSVIHLAQFRHFLEVCARYSEIASRGNLFLSCAGFFLRPRMLVLYVDETCQYCAPSIYGNVRQYLVSFKRRLHRKRPDNYSEI